MGQLQKSAQRLEFSMTSLIPLAESKQASLTVVDIQRVIQIYSDNQSDACLGHSRNVFSCTGSVENC